MTLQNKGEEWKNDSLCIEYPNINFFPSESHKREVDRAKAICRKCLVKDQCLEYAYTTHQPDGIWGGFTVKEIDRVAPFHRMRQQLTAPVSAEVIPLKVNLNPFVLKIPNLLHNMPLGTTDI